jgi:hypothetical protein
VRGLHNAHMYENYYYDYYYYDYYYYDYYYYYNCGRRLYLSIDGEDIRAYTLALVAAI